MYRDVHKHLITPKVREYGPIPSLMHPLKPPLVIVHFVVFGSPSPPFCVKGHSVTHFLYENELFLPQSQKWPITSLQISFQLKYPNRACEPFKMSRCPEVSFGCTHLSIPNWCIPMEFIPYLYQLWHSNFAEASDLSSQSERNQVMKLTESKIHSESEQNRLRDKVESSQSTSHVIGEGICFSRLYSPFRSPKKLQD